MSDLFLFRTALRDAIRPKRLTAALLLMLLPAVIALVWRSLTPADRFVPEETYNSLAASLVFGFILTILSVIYGTGVVSQEIEQRTIVYLLTRPIPRWRILLAKFAGSWLAITITTGFSVLLLALVAYGPAKIGGEGGVVLRDLRMVAVGALAYGSLFLLLATLLNRPLTYGLLFAFGWESWVPSLPGSFGRLSVMTYLRRLAPHATDEGDAGGFLQMFNPMAVPASQAWLVLSILTVAALLGALAVFSLREYAPREDAE
jgi:ABC-2 type transport system permease protein